MEMGQQMGRRGRRKQKEEKWAERGGALSGKRASRQAGPWLAAQKAPAISDPAGFNSTRWPRAAACGPPTVYAPLSNVRQNPDRLVDFAAAFPGRPTTIRFSLYHNGLVRAYMADSPRSAMQQTTFRIPVGLDGQRQDRAEVAGGHTQQALATAEAAPVAVGTMADPDDAAAPARLATEPAAR
ncbi:uncharacterized protein PSFLO_04037 [Pseudozyma flocculosa]|uniref:Uncharacterized protein n=1 Tax=Pseudozyma flocculosa TaxID=84751 RepID=A0A5C3F567_9BASI|nr:uncharacterized protein PSFLO_04037 [Pseudozyma flocculosa]